MSSKLNKLVEYMVLPPLDTELEFSYVKRINTIFLLSLTAHLPIFSFIAWFNDTGALLATVLTALTLVGPYAAYFGLTSQRQISVVMGIASMIMGGILVHIGQGSAQIEMHFYFFVMLSILVAYRNPLVIVAAAGTAAVHHFTLWALLPSSVFEHEAPFWLVSVHAGFVVVQAVAISIVARQFYDSTAQLEKRVAMRTVEVEFANREIRELLDSVQQGFLKLDCFGQIGSKHSRAVADLLGDIPASNLFTDMLARHDRGAAEWFQMGLDDVFAGIMPLELTLEQLPKQLKSNSRYLSLEYAPIFSSGELTHVVVVVSDITAVVEREKLEVESREFMAIIDRIAADQVAFLEFFEEAESLINKLRERTPAVNDEIKRDLHTLKGNSAIFGLVRITQACHAIEDYIAENNELPASNLWTELFQAWASTRGNLRRLMSDTEIKVTLGDDEYSAVLLAILNNAPKAQLAKRVAAWRLEPTRRRLECIAEQTTSLGVRLGKGELNVEVKDNGLRTDPKHWAKFWSSLVHAIRNSVDHGIETGEERLRQNKPENGTIRLSTLIEGSNYVVSIQDDGRGIQWERIQSAARQAELPSESEHDLKDALFSVGVTTRSSVTEISGRGVGMAAVRESCRSLGGVIEVQSKLGEGTEFRFVFPIESMAHEMHTLLCKYGIDNPNAITCDTLPWQDQLVSTSENGREISGLDK